MDSLRLGDVELAYQLREGGERVVLVHASAFVSWYDPLVEQLTQYSILRYRRRLRESDSGGYRALTVAEDAAICVRLMDHVGWDTAHIVGHSYGALVALQLATEKPERVGSVALLEPAVRGISSSEQVTAALQPVIAAYESGDKAAAVDGFLRHVCGDGYRAALDRVIPTAFDEALDEADMFFQAEMPAVQRWSFGAGAAGRITRPVLNVLGAESAPRFVEGSELVQSWFPRAERLSVPEAGHLLMVQDPTAVAQGLKDFFSRHPIGTVGQPEVR
ncbi:alpha/beta fold hydrolase [Rhodococcus sp. NPDC127530]|uniref:alpha/beta fold hydrolase n=1 Tax=unclassified Rhodococcus (in: high G+C Gram-positive bacteria) TaxID=192944 RepID=UPI003630988B